MAHIPERGDVLWVDFEPHVGHEQGGKRPGFVLSPKPYNSKSGMAIVCPITSKSKGYPYECELPPGLPVSGVILCDQVKNVDWRARNVQFFCTLPPEIMDEVRETLYLLLD